QKKRGKIGHGAIEDGWDLSTQESSQEQPNYRQGRNGCSRGNDHAEVQPEEPKLKQQNGSHIQDASPRRSERVEQDVAYADDGDEPREQRHTQRSSLSGLPQRPSSPGCNKECDVRERVDRLGREPRAQPFAVEVY